MLQVQVLAGPGASRPGPGKADGSGGWAGGCRLTDGRRSARGYQRALGGTFRASACHPGAWLPGGTYPSGPRDGTTFSRRGPYGRQD